MDRLDRLRQSSRPTRNGHDVASVVDHIGQLMSRIRPTINILYRVHTDATGGAVGRVVAVETAQTDIPTKRAHLSPRYNCALNYRTFDLTSPPPRISIERHVRLDRRRQIGCEYRTLTALPSGR